MLTEPLGPDRMQLLIQWQNFVDLKRELIKQGQQYAAEALTYRQKIANLAVGFIKDGSVVRNAQH